MLNIAKSHNNRSSGIDHIQKHSLCEDPSCRRTGEKKKHRNTYRCNKKGKTEAFHAKKRLPEPTLRRSGWFLLRYARPPGTVAHVWKAKFISSPQPPRFKSYLKVWVIWVWSFRSTDKSTRRPSSTSPISEFSAGWIRNFRGKVTAYAIAISSA